MTDGQTRSHQGHSAPVSGPAQGVQTRTWGFSPGEEGGLRSRDQNQEESRAGKGRTGRGGDEAGRGG